MRRKEDNAKPIENRRIRELAEAHIFHTMARFAPAFGMVGTLVGLIGMLVNMGKGNLADMGQNMAVALVTTFYGLILTNLVFRPIAVQIERRMEESLRLMKMVMEGVLMIHQKWHPYKVEDYLYSFLPPRRREMAVRRYQERGEFGTAAAVGGPGGLEALLRGYGDHAFDLLRGDDVPGELGDFGGDRGLFGEPGEEPPCGDPAVDHINPLC